MICSLDLQSFKAKSEMWTWMTLFWRWKNDKNSRKLLLFFDSSLNNPLYYLVILLGRELVLAQQSAIRLRTSLARTKCQAFCLQITLAFQICSIMLPRSVTLCTPRRFTFITSRIIQMPMLQSNRAMKRSWTWRKCTTGNCFKLFGFSTNSLLYLSATTPTFLDG